MSTHRANRRLLRVVFLSGVLLLLAGLFVGGFTSTVWSNVLIGLGAATLLFAVGVVAEPRLLAHIAESTERAAVTAVERTTDELRNRILHLEDIDRGHQTEREQYKREVNEVLRRLYEEVSHESVGLALLKAHEYRLLSEWFRVRTSEYPTGPDLYFVVMMAGEGIPFIWLSFQPITRQEPIPIGDDYLLAPVNEDGTVLWGGEEDAGQIAARLEQELIKLNIPFDEFSFQYALSRLIGSIEVMFESRNASGGSSRKLQGTLVVLINDEWVLTSHGLEAVLLDHIVPHQSFSDTNLSCPPGASEEMWQSALQYVRTGRWLMTPF